MNAIKAIIVMVVILAVIKLWYDSFSWVWVFSPIWLPTCIAMIYVVIPND